MVIKKVAAVLLRLESKTTTPAAGHGHGHVHGHVHSQQYISQLTTGAVG